ncbi:mechanosensitive ion channel family protein [Salinisphaera hydrothermalis]|uniref:Small-conductance mechanosensitive channel n=1 Tax=Salinisphaera hydrothermalis (strain C41B8) TaxID=1304275 RepID=A0A084IJP2_SALHC|nr:mechanosensitive ion channel family protein [Salinisphaera hydrothermalis]KEZ76926.1 small-conductance mechanosensitive channel [Salinisphaera hydrothermalis C41B8]
MNLVDTYQHFMSQYLSLKSEWGTVIDVAGILVITALLDLLTRGIFACLHRRVLKTRNLWDDALYRSVNGPLQVLLWIAGVSIAIVLATSPDHPWRDYVPKVRGILITLTMVWFAFRLIGTIEKNALARAARRHDKLDATTADAIAKLVRAVTLIIAGLVLLDQFGVSPSGLLTFSGVGGIAVGFAARDVLANIFGGVTVYLNRPFSVGDWIRSPDRDIEGTVEAIGWRATTVRRFDMRPLYVPNAVFSNVALENPSRMSHRLINETIGIRYEDAAIVPDLVEDIRSMLDEDENIDSEQVILTYLDSLSASSLDLLVYCYTHTTDWAEYLAIKQGVLQRVQDRIREHGGAISFPTTTIHIPGELVVARAEQQGSDDDDQEEIDSEKVQSEEKRDVARERASDQGKVGPDDAGEQ